jgi:hypothetical protein
MKANISANHRGFKAHQSFSPEEVLAAGGVTAFGIKTGKNNEELIKGLETLPSVEPFSKEEWDDLISELEKDK